MSLENQLGALLETQLEFKFFDKVRIQIYNTDQHKEMMSLYNLNYRFDGDFGEEMPLRDFVSNIWIKGGYALRFYQNNYKKYFYDI